jgi:hypothetical protein
MARKQTSEADLVKSGASAAAAPARRKSPSPVRKKHSAPQTTNAEPVDTETTIVVAVTSEPTQDEIALQAYLYWEDRGFQGGSPEEDWLRAEQELRARN